MLCGIKLQRTETGKIPFFLVEKQKMKLCVVKNYKQIDGLSGDAFLQQIKAFTTNVYLLA